jgi:hypothetical protein
MENFKHGTGVIPQDAYEIGAKLTNFYCQSVGKPMDYAKELSLLLDWEEAIAAGFKEAKKCRLGWMLIHMKEMKEQCDAFMQANRDAQ